MNQEQRQTITEALRSAQAAIWDKHYGRGLSVKYAQRVDAEIRAALAALESASPVEPACECLARTALRELLECHACGGFIKPDDDVLDSARAALSAPCPARQVEG